jgi:hypothetical protein
MDTELSGVLYLNFEISQAKLQERLRDLCTVIGIQAPINLALASLASTSLDQDDGLMMIDDLIKKAQIKVQDLRLIIIDPRRNSMGGDENQSEVMTKWCRAVDYLIEQHNLSAFIVHHTGKSTTGDGRGSSVFDAWLDGSLHLNVEEDVFVLDVKGRDVEPREIDLEFDYPEWRVTQRQAAADTTRSGSAATEITNILTVTPGRSMPQSDLRLKVLRNGHTEYAFKTALKDLVNQSVIVSEPDKTRKGNWKTVRLP